MSNNNPTTLQIDLSFLDEGDDTHLNNCKVLNPCAKPFDIHLDNYKALNPYAKPFVPTSLIGLSKKEITPPKFVKLYSDTVCPIKIYNDKKHFSDTDYFLE
jgi:hypothetical protein